MNVPNATELFPSEWLILYSTFHLNKENTCRMRAKANTAKC